jgi:hypothetical protein
MVHWAKFRLVAAIAALAAAGISSPPVLALDMPSPFVQEVLVKSILVTLNDAVAADNFTVFHAKISKPFRDQFPPELKATFRIWSTSMPCSTRWWPPIVADEGRIDEKACCA